MSHCRRRFWTRGRKSSGMAASRAARLVGDSCRRGSRYQRSSVARRRSSRSSGSSAAYSLTLARMRARMAGGRFVSAFSRSAGVMASNSRNKSTGDFAGAAVAASRRWSARKARSAGWKIRDGFGRSGKPARRPAADTATIQPRACRKRIIASRPAIRRPHAVAGSCGGWHQNFPAPPGWAEAGRRSPAQRF